MNKQSNFVSAQVANMMTSQANVNIEEVLAVLERRYLEHQQESIDIAHGMENEEDRIRANEAQAQASILREVIDDLRHYFVSEAGIKARMARKILVAVMAIESAIAKNVSYEQAESEAERAINRYYTDFNVIEKIEQAHYTWDSEKKFWYK